MNTLTDIINYVRRIIKTPNDQVMSDGLIIDYVNRFYINDVPARLQLFDLKTKFNLELRPYIDQYTIPYTASQTYTSGGVTYTIEPYPVYQGFMPPVYIDGVEVNLVTDRDSFFKAYPNFVYNNQEETGDGSTIAFSFSTPYVPILRAHIDRTGITANQNDQLVPRSSLNSAVYVNTLDSNNNPLILFDSPVPATYLNPTPNSHTTWNPPFLSPNGNIGYLLAYDYSNNIYITAGTINYVTGDFAITSFYNTSGASTAPQADEPINVQLVSQSAGMPRICMFWNNIMTVRPIPDKTYLLETDAYLTPTAFLSSSQAFQWGYMSEYLARGASRKILSDVGDIDQLQLYEPFFREQEMQVLRKSDRIVTQNRTQTIFTQSFAQSPWQFTGQQST